MDTRKWALLIFVCLWFLGWSRVPWSAGAVRDKAITALGRSILPPFAPCGSRARVRLGRVCSNWSNRPRWLFLTIILLSGDIHPNPGPPTSGARQRVLKVLSLNCCSLRSQGRRARLQGLVDEHQPDILIGCESHLDDNYPSSEVFPPGFAIFRKDRTYGGGGVFLGLKDHFVATGETSLDVRSELVWAKVRFAGRNPLHICSFYRVPNSESLSQLRESLLKLYNRGHSIPDVLAGDVNLPDIDWQNGYVQSGPEHGHEVNQMMLDIANDYGLEQLVSEPTRHNRVLDLVYSSRPTLVTNVATTPGMSDHEAVVFNIDISAAKANKKARKVFIYHKGNMDGLKDDMRAFQESFLTANPYGRTVETNWCQFKQALNTIMKTHIPQRTMKHRRDVPWLTREIRRKMRERKRLYDRAKQSQRDQDWTAYRKVRNRVNQMLEVAHSTYISKLLNETSLVMLSASGPTSGGYARIATDPKKKAEVLSNQFQSVFTKEDRTNIPDKGLSNHPTMPDISFSPDGIQKLLEGLNPSKAAGPDDIPVRILKCCAAQLAPVLQVIFTQSYTTGTLPEDWLSANITAVFKNGNRSAPVNYRPISLTAVCCKVLEHVVFRSIMQHLQEHDILNMYQHGFRSGHSCETQLLTVAEDTLKALDRREQVDLSDP